MRAQIVIIATALAAVACTDRSKQSDGPNLFDGRVHTIELEIPAPELELIQRRWRDRISATGKLTYRNQTLEDVAIKLAGRSTRWNCFKGRRTPCKKMSMRIDFDRFRDGRSFAGLRALSLRGTRTDASFSKETLAYSVYRQVGLAAPRTGFALVRLNGETLGIYVLVEPIDAAFLEHRGDSGGRLYDEVWPKHARRGPYLRALRSGDKNVDGMVALASALTAGRHDEVRKRVDLAGLARYLAVDLAIQNWDGVTKFRCDERKTPGCVNRNYVWHEPKRGAIRLIPWDVDHTFARGVYDNGVAFENWPKDRCEQVGRCELYGVPDEKCPAAWRGHEVWPPRCDPLLSAAVRAERKAYDRALRELAKVHLPAAAKKAKALQEVLAPSIALDPIISHDRFKLAHKHLLDGIEQSRLRLEVESSR